MNDIDKRIDEILSDWREEIEWYGTDHEYNKSPKDEKQIRNQIKEVFKENTRITNIQEITESDRYMCGCFMSKDLVRFLQKND